tara:strand:- start:12239 stop:12892 length:654 start_codon:yes stop_codon:yes gene_type:complete
MSKNTELAKAPTNNLTTAALSDTLDSSDIDIPRVNVVQKTSDITGPDGEPAPFGSLVLDKRFILAQPEEAIQVVPLIAQKAWREDIPFDSDDVPRIANTAEEKHQLGLDSEYGMLEFAEITLLFKGGEDSETFPFPIGKENFALGRINTAKDAYRQTFKRLATFAVFNKTTPVHTRLWNFQSTAITRGKYSWFAPSLSITNEEPSKEVQEFVEGFLS